MTAITEERRASSQAAQARKQETATPVSGIVDADDRRGYLRVAGYRRSPGDVPITHAQIRQFGLRMGDMIEAVAGPGRRDGNSGRQGKTLISVTTVNGLPAAEAAVRPSFDDLTPVY